MTKHDKQHVPKITQFLYLIALKNVPEKYIHM